MYILQSALNYIFTAFRKTELLRSYAPLPEKNQTAFVFSFLARNNSVALA
jgi:hypothetical protein